MPTHTLWANSTRRGGSNFTNVGAGTRHACLGDNDTATYIDHSGASASVDECVVGLDDITLASSEFVSKVAVRVRSRVVSGSSTPQYGLALLDPATNAEHVRRRPQPVSTATTWYTLEWVKNPVTGARWTKAWIDRAAVVIRNDSRSTLATDRTFDAALRVETVLLGTLTVANPSSGSGVVSTARPVISWTYTPTAGGGQPTHYRVKIFTHAVATGSGFNPDTSPAVYDSGVVQSSSAQHTVDPLPNLGLYREYVQVAETIAGEPAWSAWTWNGTGSWFVIVSASPPPVLTVAATADGIECFVGGRDNRLREQDASLEASGVGNWQVEALCTLARSTTWAADGVASLEQTATGSGTMIARLGGTTNATRLPVHGSRQYRAFATGRATVSRSGFIRTVWYDPAGAVISTTDSGTVTIPTGSDATITYDVTAPSGAAAVSLRLCVTSVASGNIVRWDRIGLHETHLVAPASWSRGGLIDLSPANLPESSALPTASRVYELQVSTDSGLTWRTVRRFADQNVLQANYVRLQDVEPGALTQVRVRSVWTAGDVTAAGDWSTVLADVFAPTTWWLKVPSRPELSMPVFVVDDGGIGSEAQTALLRPLVERWPVGAWGARTGLSGTLVVEVDDPDDYDQLLAIADHRGPVLVQAPADVGGAHRWVALGDLGVERVSQVGDVPWRRVTIGWTEVEPPRVDG